MCFCNCLFCRSEQGDDNQPMGVVFSCDITNFGFHNNNNLMCDHLHQEIQRAKEQNLRFSRLPGKPWYVFLSYSQIRFLRPSLIYCVPWWMVIYVSDRNEAVQQLYVGSIAHLFQHFVLSNLLGSFSKQLFNYILKNLY